MAADQQKHKANRRIEKKNRQRKQIRKKDATIEWAKIRFIFFLSAYMVEGRECIL